MAASDSRETPVPFDTQRGPSILRFDDRTADLDAHGGTSSLPASKPKKPKQSLGARLRSMLRSSAWPSLAGRGAVIVLGLVVLAWIGRAATAAPPNTPSASSKSTSAESERSTGDVEHTSSKNGITPNAVPNAPTPAPANASSAHAAPETGATVAPLSTPDSTTEPTSPPRTRTRASVEDPVYINYASIDELRRLPGVGPKRAEAIIALRRRIGRFARVEELLRVKGVGRATLRKWRPLVRLDAPVNETDPSDLTPHPRAPSDSEANDAGAFLPAYAASRTQIIAQAAAPKEISASGASCSHGVRCPMRSEESRLRRRARVRPSSFPELDEQTTSPVVMRRYQSALNIDSARS